MFVNKMDHVEPVRSCPRYITRIIIHEYRLRGGYTKIVGNIIEYAAIPFALTQAVTDI